MASAKQPSLMRNRSFQALFGAQFLGAFNDNLFKMIVSLLAIDAAISTEGAGGFLSMTGIVFIVPYLLFSGYAGFAADRFGKRTVLVISKASEVLVMLLALAALAFGDVYALLGVLFLMATQSTFFGPAKFGVLPEMLPAGQLAQANGYLEMGRYIAVIFGSVSAGGLMVLLGGEPLMLGVVLVAIAVLGAVVCLAVRATEGVRSTVPFSLNPIASIKTGIRRIAADRQLRFAVIGITFFETLAGIVMMTVLLLADKLLGLDEFASGMMLALAGLGIGIGAAIAGRLSVGRINMNLVPFATVGVAAALVGLSYAGTSVVLTALAIVMVGVFGGMFLVPLNAMLQHRAAAAEKGVTISASNFLNMTGVLGGCGFLWVLCEVFAVAPNQIILICGLIAIVAALLQLGNITRIIGGFAKRGRRPTETLLLAPPAA